MSILNSTSRLTNKTSFQLLLAGLLIAGILGLLVVVGCAQTPSKIVRPIGTGGGGTLGLAINDSPSTSTSSLKLTPEELVARDNLFKEFNPLQQTLGELFGKFLEAEEDSAALLTWAKAKRTNDKLQIVRGKILAWMNEIRKSHNCLDCDLQDDKLVRPAVKPDAKPDAKP